MHMHDLVIMQPVKNNEDNNTPTFKIGLILIKNVAKLPSQLIPLNNIFVNVKRGKHDDFRT